MQQAEKPGFIPELEATRGLAALVVAGFHVSQTAIGGLVEGWPLTLLRAMKRSDSALEAAAGQFLTALFNGEGAVVYFFVLSGFVLATSLERDPRPVPTLAWRFLLRRLFRIYPAVVATILIFLFVHLTTGLSLGWPDAFMPVSLVRNMLLLSASIDGVMWSMQTEMLAIPVIFGAFLCWRSRFLPLLIAFAALFLLLSYNMDWNTIVSGQSRTQPLFAFVFGVYVRARGAAILARIPRRLHGALALLALLALCAAVYFLASKHHMLVEAWAAAAIITILVYGRLPTVSRFLGLRPIRFLGRVSYSFYLLHPLTLMLIWRRPEFWGPIVEAGVPPVLLIFLLWAATTLAVLPIAWLVHRFVELPGIELGRRTVERLAGRAALPVPAASTSRR